MAFEGLDPVEVRRLATTLDAGANQIDEIRRLITGQLHFGAWEGPDAEHMRHEWDSYYASALSSCEQALHTLAARARANADAQVEVSNSDAGGPSAFDVGRAILAGGLGKYGEDVIVAGLGFGAIFDGLRTLIPAEKLAKLAAGAKTFHGVFRYFSPIALGFDIKAMHDDVKDHDPNALAYDEVVTGLDGVSTALTVVSIACPVAGAVLEPIADGINVVSGVMTVVGLNHTAKDFIGGGIRLYEKPFIDDYEDPFRNPLETIGSIYLNPQLAAPAIGAGIVHDGVKLLSKIF